MRIRWKQWVQSPEMFGFWASLSWKVVTLTSVEKPRGITQLRAGARVQILESGFETMRNWHVDDTKMTLKHCCDTGTRGIRLDLRRRELQDRPYWISMVRRWKKEVEAAGGEETCRSCRRRIRIMQSSRNEKTRNRWSWTGRRKVI